MRSLLKDRFSQGFTLIEVMVLAPFVILTIITFVAVIITVTGEVIAVRGQNNLAYKTQLALEQIERDIRLSGAFLAANEFTAQTPQGYDDDQGLPGDFENVGTNGDILILRTPATDASPLDSSRSVVRTNQPAGNCNVSSLPNNDIFFTNIVYFVKNNTLWKRTLIDQGGSAPTLCSTPWQLPSCDPSVTKGSYCSVDDEALLDNVSIFSIEYFTNAAEANPDTTASDSNESISARDTALTNLKTVRVSVTSNTTSGGRDVDYSANLRADRL